MPRVVVEGINSKEGKILLVRGSRGLTKGIWSLPGGFLRFGETPEQGLVREFGEELGVVAQIERLFCVRAKLGVNSRLHWIMIFYQISISGKLSPDPDEIAEARYFPLPGAKELLSDKSMQDVVASLSHLD
jgi:ADP-ribose pyrophosphatase YjhB (NUDIX family)